MPRPNLSVKAKIVAPATRRQSRGRPAPALALSNSVILSGAGSSRSELPAESKDPYKLIMNQSRRKAFSPRSVGVCRCEGPAHNGERQSALHLFWMNATPGRKHKPVRAFPFQTGGADVSTGTLGRKPNLPRPSRQSKQADKGRKLDINYSPLAAAMTDLRL